MGEREPDEGRETAEGQAGTEAQGTAEGQGAAAAGASGGLRPRTATAWRRRFERFTERAKRVLVLAQEEAPRFNHNYIGTEHLLLGLLRVEEGNRRGGAEGDEGGGGRDAGGG